MDNSSLIAHYYSQHRQELAAYVAARMGGDRMAADDLVQELFLRLLQGARPITAATLPSLAYTMARHLLADHYRHLAHQRRYQQQLLASCAEPALQPEPALWARDMLSHVERRLQRMPQPCADVYRLHLYQGMTCGDIARHLNLDYKATEYRLGQARRQVRHLLAASF